MQVGQYGRLFRWCKLMYPCWSIHAKALHMYFCNSGSSSIRDTHSGNVVNMQCRELMVKRSVKKHCTCSAGVVRRNHICVRQQSGDPPSSPSSVGPENLQSKPPG